MGKSIDHHASQLTWFWRALDVFPAAASAPGMSASVYHKESENTSKARMAADKK